MRALRGIALLAWLATGLEPYGICYTRNQVSTLHEVGHLVQSATSVVRAVAPAKIPLCLFTDARGDADNMTRSLGYGGRGPLFDYVLEDSYAFFAPLTAAETALLNPRSTDRHYESRHLIRSRVGKILNLARSPFEMALFADDDTYFCGGGLAAASLAGALAFFHKERHRYTLRARLFKSHHSPYDDALSAGRACVWAAVGGGSAFSAALEAKCYDRALEQTCLGGGIQSGALAVTRGAALEELVNRWLDAYIEQHLAYFELGRRRASAAGEGSDQSAFVRVAKGHCDRREDDPRLESWTLGWLPATFNVRNVDRELERASAAASRNATPGDAPGCPKSPGAKNGKWYGPLLLLHQKKYMHKDLDGICAAVNRPVARGGSAWLGTDDGGLGCAARWEDAKKGGA